MALNSIRGPGRTAGQVVPGGLSTCFTILLMLRAPRPQGGSRVSRTPSPHAEGCSCTGSRNYKVKVEQLRPGHRRPSGSVASCLDVSLSPEEGIRTKESGKCPVTVLREENGCFGERPYFLEALGGSGRGPGVGTCSRAKTFEKGVTAALPSGLGEDPEILMARRRLNSQCLLYYIIRGA